MMEKISVQFILFLMVTLYSQGVRADMGCTEFRPNLPTETYEEFIGRNDLIIIGEVEGVEFVANHKLKRGKAVRYKIKVLEVIRGVQVSYIDVYGMYLDEESYGHKELKEDMKAYSSMHQKEAFYKNMAMGSTPVVKELDGKCRYLPHLASEYKYLMFLSKPYRAKSFEVILSENDKWLRIVKEIVNKSGGYGREK